MSSVTDSRRTVFEKLALEIQKPDPLVIEFGCASAPNLAVVKIAKPEAYVVGVDVSAKALKSAKELFEETFKQGGFLFTEHICKADRADLVIFDRVLYCLPAWEIMAVLRRFKNAKTVVIDDFYAAPPVRGKYDAQDYSGFMWDLGFRVRSLEKSQYPIASPFHAEHAKIGIFERP